MHCRGAQHAEGSRDRRRAGIDGERCLPMPSRACAIAHQVCLVLRSAGARSRDHIRRSSTAVQQAAASCSKIHEKTSGRAGAALGNADPLPLGGLDQPLAANETACDCGARDLEPSRHSIRREDVPAVATGGCHTSRARWRRGAQTPCGARPLDSRPLPAACRFAMRHVLGTDGPNRASYN